MIQIIGWTILHSLWQIALLASLYLLIKNNWRTKTALKKYYLAVSALVTTFLSTIFTCSYLYQQENWMVTPITDSNLIPIISETSTTTLIPVQSNEIVVETTITLADYLTICLPYLVAFWGLGMLYFTIRFLKNLYGVKQLQNIDNELISGEWLAKIKIFKTQLNIQKDVQVFLSLHIKEPITFGHFKPIILLPISLITGFDTAAIETILLHELAHIKRHDYLVNLGQSFIEIILFYHPLIWWLSKDIRELREHCCDDLVLSLGDNRITYVETLTALQWRKVGGVTNRLSLSASGGDAGFSRRIKRMFGVEEKRGSFRQLMGVFLVLLLVAIGAFTYQKYYKPTIATDDTSEMPYLDKEFIYHIDFNYTNGDMDKIREEIKQLGITLGPSTFSKMTTICNEDSLNAEIIRAVKGSYYREYGRTIFFESPDLAQFPLKLMFDGGNLKEPERLNAYGKEVFKTNSFTYTSEDNVAFLINEHTRKEDLIFWKEKLKRAFISFSFEESVFDDAGHLLELRGKYKTQEKEGDFYGRLPCVNVKFELYKDQLSEPVFSYPCKEKNIGNLESKVLIDTLTYMVSNEMTRIELYEMITKIRAHSQVSINLDPLKTKFDKQDKLAAISGKYYYERPTRTPIQTFEVADLGQFQLQFKAHPAISFAPAYYNSATDKFIQVDDNYSAFGAFAKDAVATGGTLIVPSRTYKNIHAILIINEYSNMEDLKAFAEKILPNNIIFRYQDSEFRPDGTIAKLVGTFLGDSRISEPFYVDDLTKYQVKLRVDKNYIYQPEITQQIKTNSTPLSYKINNWKALDLDSTAYGLKKRYENDRGNSIAQLIPPYVAVDDSVRAMNPIYRVNTEKTKSVFVNGQKVVKKDLPTFMENQLQEAIKTDTTVDWLYWGDQKINLGKAYKKEENGTLKWDVPKLQISKEVWDNNKDRPFIFQIDGNWYRVKDLEMAVLVPYKGDPASVNFHKDYAKALSNKTGSVFKLLARVKEKDHLYFEKMDIGLPKLIYMVVEIIENNSTGFIPKEAIQFDEKDDLMSMGDYPPAYQNSTLSKLKIDAFAPKNMPATSGLIWSRIPPKKAPVYIIDGVKYKGDLPKKLLSGIIESMNVQMGLKAQTLYGEEEVSLITTKAIKEKKTNQQRKNNLSSGLIYK